MKVSLFETKLIAQCSCAEQFHHGFAQHEFFTESYIPFKK